MFLCKSLRGHELLKETKIAEWDWRSEGKHCGMITMDTYLDHEILDLNVHEKKHKLNRYYGYHSFSLVKPHSSMNETYIKITTDV